MIELIRLCMTMNENQFGAFFLVLTVLTGGFLVTLNIMFSGVQGSVWLWGRKRKPK